jgi:hypothetical protein
VIGPDRSKEVSNFEVALLVESSTVEAPGTHWAPVKVRKRSPSEGPKNQVVNMYQIEVEINQGVKREKSEGLPRGRLGVFGDEEMERMVG